MTITPPHMTDRDIEALVAARHDRPFDVLGVHKKGRQAWCVALVPDASSVSAHVGKKTVPLERLRGPIFGAQIPNSKFHHSLTAVFDNGSELQFEDPYRFGPVLSDLDQYLIGEGTHRQLWDCLGAHVTEHAGVAGTHFAVWAPNAARVSVVGSFNNWDGRRHPMRRVGVTGVWEIFLPGIGEGELYKYEIASAGGGLFLKSDPVGFGAQQPPETSSIVRDIGGFDWADDAWMSSRAITQQRDKPISIYEVHLGSWRRGPDNRRLTYQELAKDLVEYASWMGFTHLEFLPVSEFPFDGSWGYQPVGLYAPTSRFGLPDDFRHLVNAVHNAGLGVILDWVPGHFPSDPHGLAQFDGSHLYEHADPREGFHQDWNTLIYNYGRTEVRNFLTANALYWLKEYHVDGLRVDAVASMLYRDYSRKHDEWIPNKDGGRENLEAIDFLKEMNVVCYGEVDGVMTIAEESTAFPGVSTPTDAGGLGFGFKWNMGWMNDTLRFMEKDPIYRRYDHHLMTFPIDYSFSENFILPISHDEVVHGKHSMVNKMPGDEWEKFANLRAYYGFMWGHPGKKLLFMGCEFAQWDEWNHDVSLDWDALHGDKQRGIQALVRDLNQLYRNTPALYRKDCEREGFAWIANDPEQSLTAFVRYGEEDDHPVVIVCNFTPVERRWRIGLPRAGQWAEILNTDSSVYGGADRGNDGQIETGPIKWDGQAQSAEITVPPLATIMFQHRV